MRSRHETHWAKFFDHLGWPWLYEPIRTPGYIPDFGLGGRFLAEIKPERTVQELTIYVPKVTKGLNGVGYSRPFVILGNSPLLRYGPGLMLWPAGKTWSVDHAMWATCRAGHLVLSNRSMQVSYRPCGCEDGASSPRNVDVAALRKLWASTTRRRTK